MGIEAGIDPLKFWTYTLAEIRHLIARQERADELQWVHTSNLMALSVNMNRRKGGKTYSWQDFTPYDPTEKRGPIEQVDKKHHEQAKKWAAKF